MTLTKRGTVYYLDTTLGGRRVRCSLGVRDRKAAERVASRVGFAVADGPKSEVWKPLKQALPSSGFRSLTSGLCLPKSTAISEFEKRFEEALGARVRLGELSERSHDLYAETGRRFFGWLQNNSVRKMDEIDRGVIEKYLIDRKEGKYTGRPLAESSLQTEVSVLKAIFSYAIEDKVVESSPLVGIRDSRSLVSHSPEPFTSEEILRLDSLRKARETDLIYKLFRFTGLRSRDVSDLQWSAIDWNSKTLTWETHKRGRRVVVPIVPALYDSLHQNYVPEEEEVLKTKTAKLYQIIKRLGEEAAVENCHPHKFRTHFICELLAKGASIYDVAAMVGDNVNTIQLYYAAITDKQQERVRGIMEN